MSSLVTLLMGLAGPMVLRALLVLGIGTVTFTGVTASISGLMGSAVNSWAAMPYAVLQLASLGGVPEGLGIVCGAIVARVTLWSAVSASRFVLNK